MSHNHKMKLIGVLTLVTVVAILAGVTLLTSVAQGINLSDTQQRPVVLKMRTGAC